MTESPLGSPISHRDLSPETQKSPSPDKSGVLKGRDVTPLSADSFGGSPLSDEAEKIAKASKSELEKSTQGSQKEETREYEVPSESTHKLLEKLTETATKKIQGTKAEAPTTFELYEAFKVTLIASDYPEEDIKELLNKCQKLGIKPEELFDPNGHSLLHIALVVKKPEVASMLIEHGISPDIPNKDGTTLLSIVSDAISTESDEEGKILAELAIDLIDAGADTSHIDEEHWDHLLKHCLKSLSHDELEDRDVFFPPALLEEALVANLDTNNWEAVKKLVNFGVDPDSTYKDQPLLRLAYEAGKKEGDYTTVNTLLHRKATNILTLEENRELLNKFKNESAHGIFKELISDALSKNQWDEVFSYVAMGASLKKEYNNDTLLHHAYLHAINTDDFDPCLKLLEMGKITLEPAECKDLLERINAKGLSPEIPIKLFTTVFTNLPPDILAQRDNAAWSKILDILFTRDLEVLKLMGFPQEFLLLQVVHYLELGDRVRLNSAIQLGGNLQDLSRADQETLIAHSINSSQDIAFLKKIGVVFDQDVVDDLFYSYAQTGSTYQMQCACMLGANVESYDADGNTAFHQVMKNGNLAKALQLMKFGANPLAENLAGQTPYSMATMLIAEDTDEFVALYNLIQTRFEDIKRSPLYQRRDIADTELRQLAYIIEVTLPHITATAKEAIGKIPKEMHGMPHSLLYRVDTEEKKLREIQLLLQSTGRIRGSGSFKKATEVITVPLQLNQETAERQAFVITHKDLSKKSLRAVAEEMQLYKELQPYLWPINFVYNFTHQVGMLQKQRIAFSSPPGKTVTKQSFTLEELIPVAKTLAENLAGIHKAGYVHGDLKGDNALVAGTKAGLTDVGFAHKVGGKASVDMISFGFYGSIFCTAPELFGNRNFAGDQQKLDVFAYGDMLYRKHFSPDKSLSLATPWYSLLEKYRDTARSQPVEEVDKTAFLTLLQDHIVAPYNALMEKSSLTRQEQFERIIYKALLPDPNQRPTMQELLAALNAI